MPCKGTMAGGQTYYTNKSCPANSVGTVMPGNAFVCRKTAPPSCPTGSTFYMLMTNSEMKGVCISNTVQSYLRPAPAGGSQGWPCNGTDPLSEEPTTVAGAPRQYRCFPLPAGATGTGTGTGTGTDTGATQQPANPPFATLDTNYQAQVAAYEAAMNSSIQQNDPSRLPELRTMSEGIQNTLNKMIESLTYLKRETPVVRGERDTLLEKLRRIQQDYSAMITNTDDLETLRRIREQENGEARRMLLLYLFAFLFVCCMLLIYLVYTGRKTPTSPTTAATPNMSPPLT